MEKEVIIKDFKEELRLFYAIVARDLKKGFTVDQVKDALENCTQAFYGSRLDYDNYAMDKCAFIATYSNQIIGGHPLETEDFDELYNNIKRNKVM